MRKTSLINPNSISKYFSILLLVDFIFAMNGCASSGTAIPQGGPTMAEVYQEAMHASNADALDNARQQITAIKANPANNTRSAINFSRNQFNEINNLFPQLPNPPLIMYVYPHLTGEEQTPVPGYSTAFPLYDKTHYALPIEAD